MKVIGVEEFSLEEPIDVYCLEVDHDFHSFCLGNGCVVHNCGTIISARNANYQGVLPIRGKILNVMKLDLSNKKQRERFVNNAEIDDIVKALGAGVGDSFDIDKARYGKVVFACDQDSDGLAINCLLLGLFYKLFRPLIEEGRVYQCVSPFYEFHYKERGKERFEYAIDEKERMEIEKRLKDKNVKYDMGRAKGLGELNADVFHDIVLDPTNRKLIRITIDDAKAAEEMMHLSIGMGSADSRKGWMLDHTDVVDSLGLYS